MKRTEDDDGGSTRDEIIPDGYESEADFLAYWIQEYQKDFEYDKDNREEAMKDLEFIYVDQWDPETRAEREDDGRPCLTINTLPQFIGQVIGDRRVNKTSIKVIPDKKADQPIAEARSGLIKSIENFSRAERVYDACCEDQVGCGISNFEIALDYARNDVFHQDIFIRQFHNPFAVTWDRLHRDVTGKDARHCFVEDVIPRDVFEEDFDMEVPDDFPTEIEGAEYDFWCDDDGVRICSLWIMVDKPAMFALMDDGEVEDVTDRDPLTWGHRVARDPNTNEPIVNEGVRTYAQRWLITGFAILEGPYELPLSRLPIIKVSGRVGRVGNKQYRFGLTRWARDPSLMRNYWRSISAEMLAMAPKAQWIAGHASVKGREEDFRNAHLTGDPLLIYNTGKDQPKRIDPPDLPAAVLNEAGMNAQDIKDVTGIHDASLGIRSNEVSGKAIMARQREGDIASVTYHDHLNMSIEEGGDVMNQLIPLAYDSIRTIRVIGPDEEPSFLTINDPDDDNSPDITLGKHVVKIITGPSYTTQRMESAEAMLEVQKAFPEIMAFAGDIMVEGQDWPLKDKLVKRMQRAIPGIRQAVEEEEAEEQQAQGGQPQVSQEEMMAAAMQQQQMQMAQAQMEAQMAEMQAKVAEATAKAEEAAAKAQEAQLRAEEAAERLREAKARADKAEADAEKADDDVAINRAKGAAEVRTREESRSQSASQSNRDEGSRPQGGSRSRRKTRAK